VTPEVTFDESLRLMEQHGVYHLLILGEGNRYLGMMSVSDLLKVMALDVKARADMLESYVFPNREGQTGTVPQAKVRTGLFPKREESFLVKCCEFPACVLERPYLQSTSTITATPSVLLTHFICVH